MMEEEHISSGWDRERTGLMLTNNTNNVRSFLSARLSETQNAQGGRDWESCCICFSSCVPLHNSHPSDLISVALLRSTFPDFSDYNSS